MKLLMVLQLFCQCDDIHPDFSAYRFQTGPSYPVIPLINVLYRSPQRRCQSSLVRSTFLNAQILFRA